MPSVRCRGALSYPAASSFITLRLPSELHRLQRQVDEMLAALRRLVKG